MTNNTASKRLEAVREQLQAAHDTQYSYPSDHTRGIATGLRLAIQTIDAELITARQLEAIQNQ